MLTAVAAVGPYNGAVSVPVGANVTVTFDVAMNAATVNSTTVQLRDANNQAVPAAVAYNATTRTATLDPTANLAAGATYYYARVVGGATGVKDANGTPLPADFTWSFTTGTPAFGEAAVFSGLTQPTAVQFAPDGRVFVAEKGGVIKVFDSLSDPTPDVFADLRTEVYNYWDRGLLGLALDPQFTTGRPYVYALYTYDALIGGTAPKWGTPGQTSDPGGPDPTGAGTLVSGRLVRLTAAGNAMVPGSEKVLVNDWNQQFPSHSIGDLAFGPDGYLYASGGDGASFNFVDSGQNGNPFNDPVKEGGALRSQDLLSPADPAGLNGAVIRVDPDTGDAAPGNPLAASADPNARRIIASGLRNPFRITFRPGTRELFVDDTGWNTWEEINRIPDVSDLATENFGWPAYEGNGPQAGYQSANLPLLAPLYADPSLVTKPFYTYNHAAQVVAGSAEPTGSSSSTGLAFYAGGSYPAAYDGSLFFADYTRKQIYVMHRGPNGLPDPSTRQVFRSTASGAVQLRTGPGGDLFYVDMNGGRVVRVTYSSPTGNRPPTAAVTADKTTGGVPLTTRCR